MKFYINGLQTRTEISIIILVGLLPTLVTDSPLHGWHFTAQMSLPKWDSRKFSEVDFREFFFCVLSVEPDRAKWGEKFPRQTNGNKAKSLRLAGQSRTLPATKVKAGDSIPARDMAIRLTGENARNVCPPLEIVKVV